MTTVQCSICGSMTIPCRCCTPGYHTIPPVFYPNDPPAKGWVCPLCGKANAPTTPQCFCKPEVPAHQPDTPK